MSDDHEEHHHGFAFQFGPTPEQIEQARMAGESNGHETREFFDSLTEQQLRKLSGLFHHSANTDGAAAVFYVGLISGFLDLKYKSCMACGKDHDKLLAEMSGQEAPAEEASDASSASGPAKGTKHYDELMDLYNMEQDDDGSDKVMCKNCSLWYNSLQDRMLRKPGVEGCHGCQHKSAWG